MVSVLSLTSCIDGEDIVKDDEEEDEDHDDDDTVRAKVNACFGKLLCVS